MATAIPPELQRQTTAVPDRSSDSMDTSMAGVSLIDTDDSMGTPIDTSSGSHATAMPMAIHERSSSITPEGGRSDNGIATTVASLAQTPMNDIFLSTLAFDPLGTPIGSAPASGGTSRVSEEDMIVEEPEDNENEGLIPRGDVDDEHLLDNVHS